MRIRSLLILFFLLLVGFGDCYAAGGKLMFTYSKPSAPELQSAYTELLNSRALEAFPVPKYGPPQDITIELVQCGNPDAHYDPARQAIVVCYELYAGIKKDFDDMLRNSNDTPAGAVATFTKEALGFIVLHELSHALIHQNDLPIVGKEEDSADQLAALMLVEKGGDTASETLLAITTYFSYLAAKQSNGHEPLAFWSEHSLDAQRFYDLLCLVYGSNPKRPGYEKLLGGNGLLPADRGPGCVVSFNKAVRAWAQLFRRFGRV